MAARTSKVKTGARKESTGTTQRQLKGARANADLHLKTKAKREAAKTASRTLHRKPKKGTK